MQLMTGSSDPKVTDADGACNMTCNRRGPACIPCRADEWNRHHHSVDPSASDSGRDDSHPMTGRSSAHSVQSSHDSPRSSGEGPSRWRSHLRVIDPADHAHALSLTIILPCLRVGVALSPKACWGRQGSCRGRRCLGRMSARTTMIWATGESQCAGRTRSS